MLHIRPEQLEVLISGKTHEFKRRLAKHLHRFFPEDCGRLGTRLPHVIAMGIDKARFYGFRSERDICKYLNLMFHFGPNFDDQPDFIWAATLLTNPKLKRADLKMRRLYAEATCRSQEEPPPIATGMPATGMPATGVPATGVPATGVPFTSNAVERTGKNADHSFAIIEPGSTTQTCPSDDKGSAWVEIKILSACGEPVANETYIIELKDGTQLEGKTDEFGVAHEEGLDKGSCKLILPNRDKASIKT